jgi:glutamate racemase
MLAQGIDTVVLGCTHYPFVIPLIEEIVGPAVRVIDPAPAVARQARRLLEANGLYSPTEQDGIDALPIRIITTGEVGRLEALLPDLLGESIKVEEARWKDDKMLSCSLI